MGNSNQDTAANNEVDLQMGSIKDTMGSLTSFFSIVSGIILVLSISYTVGYFKYINPQLVELLKIGDYLDEAAHNVWLFAIAIVLFFSSSLGFVKRKISGKSQQIILLGVFTLLACLYIFFRGINHSKFWPVIGFLLKDNILMPAFLLVLLASIALTMFMIYKISNTLTTAKSTPLYYVNIVPIIAFLMVVMAPYLAGMIQGYTESVYLTKEDYKFQLVDIGTAVNSTMIKGVLIVKQIDKGLIIRQFEQASTSNSLYSFLSLGNIMHIAYNDMRKEAEEDELLAPTLDAEPAA